MAVVKIPESVLKAGKVAKDSDVVVIELDESIDIGGKSHALMLPLEVDIAEDPEGNAEYVMMAPVASSAYVTDTGGLAFKEMLPYE